MHRDVRCSNQSREQFRNPNRAFPYRALIRGLVCGVDGKVDGKSTIRRGSMKKIAALGTGLLAAGMAFATSFTSSNHPSGSPVTIVTAPAPIPTSSTPITAVTQWVDCAQEGQACSVLGTVLVRYGAGNTFVTKEVSGRFTCGNGLFGDPVPNVVKSCSYAVVLPPPEQWITCANEHEICIVPESARVRYGARGVFAFRTASRQIMCHNAVFGDPVPNVVKSCAYLVAPTSTPTAPPPSWVGCAQEGQTCSVSGKMLVRYGAGNMFVTREVTGRFTCGNGLFGDPVPNVVKSCSYVAAPTSTPPMAGGSITPIASNFHSADLIGKGYSNPVPSAKPDVVGSFRFICTAGQVNYDDPIIYPGEKGGSAHLHQFYGNTKADYSSTYASLRTTGDSTCSNPLNRSAYWAPALMNAAGQLIRPDYLSIYYKRRPDGDPMCRKQAADGCFDTPTGLRVVSGFDMKRMNEAQPQNKTYHFRCISAGKPSVHRGTTAEAIADCGGAGQIMAAIGFGSCWNGQLDSADHRSHLVTPRYVGNTYAECPKDHPKLLPQLTQQIAYTIEKTDGEVYFTSDRMSGMKMPGGSTFHADYMEAWDPSVRETWHRFCIGKMLNCSDGELGDGTMLKRPRLTYLASPRLVTAPVR